MAAESVDVADLAVRRARKGDRRAFEQLYRAHVGQVYGLCLRMTGRPAEAEDCAQDAFIQAWRKLGQFRGDAAFGTWLHRITVNAVLARRRRMRPEDPLDDGAELGAAAESPADQRDLEAAVATLPEGARHVFVLLAVYGYTHEEAGEMLGIASGTCKAQLHRARRLLAERLSAGPTPTEDQTSD
ncbi:RNA polymerase sigma factor [Lentisalinibacter orientalis]|uniref:RNA polymerase sigma factor n=1 Tax=Lentisalinibacter orientalis TaxID=2992241 RepID=UPI00386AE77A